MSWHNDFIFGRRESKRLQEKCEVKKSLEGLPGGAGVKNPPANAGDTGLSAGPGRSHMLWSN